MTVRNALLGLLSQRARHGYDLLQAFQAVAGGPETWDVKPAQIYTTLSRLEESGLVTEEGIEQSGGPEKRIYAITQAGQRELENWFISPVQSDHQRDEFFLKLMMALATGEKDLSKVISIQRAYLYQELHDLTALRMQLDPQTGLARILLLDQAVMHLEADLRWMDMIEARLEDVRRQPLPEREVRPRGRPPKEKRNST